jgi:hypothetical protein
MVRAWIVGAAILTAWYGALATREAGIYEGVPYVLHVVVLAVAASITAALGPRHKILAGASLAVVPAVFVAALTATAKPTVMMLVPTGPLAAPFYAVATLVNAALPCTVGAVSGAFLLARKPR